MAYYAVVRGRQIGIFTSWQECLEQVHRYPRACFKRFSTQQEAAEYIAQNAAAAEPNAQNANPDDDGYESN